MDQTTSQQLEGWGYLLLPPRHTESLGNSGLLVVLHHEPRQAHFEVAEIHLWLSAGNYQPFSLTVLKAHSEFSMTHRMGAGLIRLTNANRQAVEFLTFGGQVSTEQKAGEAIYLFQSDAPILSLATEAGTKAQFSREVQVELAKLKAEYQGQDAEFVHRLAQQSAQSLYRQMVNTVWAKMEGNAGIRQASPQLYHALKQEKQWLSNHAR